MKKRKNLTTERNTDDTWLNAKWIDYRKEKKGGKKRRQKWKRKNEFKWKTVQKKK